MGRPSSPSSAIPWFGSRKDERKRPTLQDETIEGVIELTPRWVQEALKTAFDGILKQQDKKRIASKSRIIASKKHRRIVLKKKRVVSNVYGKHNKQEIANWLDIHRHPSTSTTMEPSTSKIESYKSKTKAPTTSSMTPSTPIPKQFRWICATSTFEERQKFLQWAHSKADEIDATDPDEKKRLLFWTEFLVYTTIVRYPQPENCKTFLQWGLSTSAKEAPDERKRLLKWAHFTAKIAAPDERKRWSLQEQILLPFEIALELMQKEINKYAEEYALRYGLSKNQERYPHANQEHMIYTFKGKHGLYECRNALWIWTKHSGLPGVPLSEYERGPIYFGEKIKDNLPESDMIRGRPSVNELGFVTIELSGKWIAKSIHRMLKNGLCTWAPKLSVERVAVVDHTSLDGRINLNLAREVAIGYTLKAILGFSNVDVLATPIPAWPIDRNAMLAQLNRWFPFEEREEDVLIKGQIPFILPKGDFENAYKDIYALWHRVCDQKADWIVYITPVWQHVYIDMCLAAAELEKWILIDGLKTACTSYVGYEACHNHALEDSLLDKARIRLDEAADLLGYSADAILECVLKYASLKIRRLAVCTFDINEMLNEEGNTFVYLLNTRAKLRRITDGYRKDINEVKKASKLKLEKDKGWEKGEERMLGFHLLEFTEALEESCLSVLPHILCEYVYDLSKKFNRYHLSVCKDGFVAETSTLLLYEATAVVMEQCFQLLGIIPTCEFFFLRSLAQPPSDLFPAVERPMDVIARDPYRNSRFQLFSLRTRPITPLGFDREGKLFGSISVSDKRGLLADRGSQFFEPDFAHVPLFNYDWLNPIDMVDGELVYLGSPSVPLSSFSSFISVRMELYVTKTNECYQVCNQNKVIDLSEFWGKKLDGECGRLSVDVEDGSTRIYYIVLKDAVDTALEVEFKTTDILGRKVRGYVLAYYGDEFLWECQSGPAKDCYYALLFLPKPSYLLQAGKISLIKSQLAVPSTGSLIVKAYLEDFYSGKVIMNNSCKFKAQLGGCSWDTISGSEGCSLEFKVDWNYQD